MDLRTNYMGIDLVSPIIVSASTLSEDIHNIAEMEENGAGAVVLFSLFEEQIRKEEAKYASVMTSTSEMFAEASGFFPAWMIMLQVQKTTLKKSCRRKGVLIFPSSPA